MRWASSSLFGKESKFGCRLWASLVNLKAFPNMQLSRLELLNCQWECRHQAAELSVLFVLVRELSPVLFHLDPDSVRLKAEDGT